MGERRPQGIGSVTAGLPAAVTGRLVLPGAEPGGRRRPVDPARPTMVAVVIRGGYRPGQPYRNRRVPSAELLARVRQWRHRHD